MMAPKPVVLLSGPEDDEASEPAMKFRLTYEGPLRPTGNDPVRGQRDPLARHKQEVRKVFHNQLKQFWASDEFLSKQTLSRHIRRGSRPAGDEAAYYGEAPDQGPMDEVLAEEYEEFGYRFVPLVCEEWKLLCSLKILFLRRDFPGSGVITAGDIDNRIKTMIDALRRPRNATELKGHEIPDEGEDPFYVLLEDDKQVTHLEVETDRFLDPVSDDNADQSRVHIIVTVELRPYFVTMFNLSFA